MALLLKNVYALDGRLRPARRVDLRITEAGVIGTIAPAGSLKPQPDDCVDDRHDGTAVIPAFANAHCHAAMSLFRGLGEDEPLMEWLERKIWPVEARLTPQTVRAGTELAAAEMALSGAGCFADMYYHMEVVAEVVRRVGLRGALSVGVVSRDDKLLAASLQKDLTPYRGPLTRLNLDPHAPYTVSLAGMERIARFGRENGLTVQTHFLEAEWERGYIKKTFGMEPVEYLEKTGLLELDHLVLAHGVWLTEGEMKELAGRGNVTVVHCPASNLKLGSGVAALPAMMDAGLPVALGTDGAASNNRLDLWSEMRLMALIHKGTSKDPTAVPAHAALNCATLAGYRAFGFEGVGLIEEGWQADLTLVDLSGPQYVGADEDNLAGFIVYSGSSADVTDLLVVGRWIVKNRDYLPDPVESLTEAARRARRTLQSGASEAGA